MNRSISSSDSEEEQIEIEKKLIGSLQSKQGKRSKEELYIISKFLEKSMLINKLRREKVADESIKKIIYQLSNNIKHEPFENQQMVFHQDDDGDKFYIILDGEVEILKDQEIQSTISFEEYLKYLIDLCRLNDKKLAEKIIKFNRHVFGITNKEIYILEKILFSLSYKENILKFIDKLNESSNGIAEIIENLKILNKMIIDYVVSNKSDLFVFKLNNFIIDESFCKNNLGIDLPFESYYEIKLKYAEKVVKRNTSVIDSKLRNDIAENLKNDISVSNVQDVYNRNSISISQENLRILENDLVFSAKDYRKKLTKKFSSKINLVESKTNINKYSTITKLVSSNKNDNSLTRNKEELKESLDHISNSSTDLKINDNKIILGLKDIPYLSILDLLEKSPIMNIQLIPSQPSELKNTIQELTDLKLDLSYLLTKELETLKEYKFEKYENFQGKKEKVSLFKRNVVVVLKKYMTFGDLALDGISRSRMASVKAKGKLDLASISSVIYTDFIQVESKKISKKNSMFLIDNFFFKGISKMMFETRFYPFFNKEFYPKGTVLFRENDEIEKIYFLKEGEVEISTYKTFLELNSYYKENIKILVDKISKTKNIYLTNEEISELYELASLEVENNKYGLKFKLNSKTNPVMQLPELKKDKINFKMSILGNNEVLGIEEIYMKKKKWDNSAIVSSTNGVHLFELKLEPFFKVLTEIEIKENFNIISYKKTLCYLKRLENFRNQIIDKKLSGINYNVKSKNAVILEGHKDAISAKNNASAKINLTITSKNDNYNLNLPKIKNTKENKKQNYENKISKKSNEKKLKMNRKPTFVFKEYDEEEKLINFNGKNLENYDNHHEIYHEEIKNKIKSKFENMNKTIEIKNNEEEKNSYKNIQNNQTADFNNELPLKIREELEKIIVQDKNDFKLNLIKNLNFTCNKAAKHLNKKNNQMQILRKNSENEKNEKDEKFTNLNLKKILSKTIDEKISRDSSRSLSLTSISDNDNSNQINKCDLKQSQSTSKKQLKNMSSKISIKEMKNKIKLFMQDTRNKYKQSDTKDTLKTYKLSKTNEHVKLDNILNTLENNQFYNYEDQILKKIMKNNEDSKKINLDLNCISINNMSLRINTLNNKKTINLNGRNDDFSIENQHNIESLDTINSMRNKKMILSRNMFNSKDKSNSKTKTKEYVETTITNTLLKKEIKNLQSDLYNGIATPTNDKSKDYIDKNSILNTHDNSKKHNLFLNEPINKKLTLYKDTCKSIPKRKLLGILVKYKSQIRTKRQNDIFKKFLE